MYLYVKQKCNKRNKELHEDAWSYGVVTPSHSHTHTHTQIYIYIYSDGVIYWPYPNFIKSRVYYAHALTLILFQVTNSVFFFF